MRRPNRNIEIFSMSVLDLFASALGGFIMIAVILFPSYMSRDRLTREIDTLTQEIDQAEKKIEDKDAALEVADKAQRKAEEALANAEEEVDESARVLEGLQEQVASLELQAARTFLIITVEWEDNLDVDLTVTDPLGREFAFNKTNRDGALYDTQIDPETGERPTTWSELSRDQLTGPGVEIWQAPTAVPGSYKVNVKLFSPGRLGTDGQVNIRLIIFGRVQRMTLDDIFVSRSKQNHNFTLDLAEDGTWEIVR